MNNYTTADTNWKSIHYPITEHMILGEEPVPKVDITDTIYYNLTEKSSSTTVALRDFHNMYVKRKLIEGVSKYLKNKMRITDVFLMDYAVGKAGDLSKWSHSDLRFVSELSDSVLSFSCSSIFLSCFLVILFILC